MNRSKTNGFTLVETAIVLVIIGLLLGGLLKGAELITSTRVRNLIAHQDGVKAAFLGFEERFRAVPGDYVQATINIRSVTQNGNGNGRIEITTTPNETILAWEHLSRAGFLAGTYTYSATESAATSPINPYGVYQQIVYDGIYGAGTTGSPSVSKHNIKTGSQIPATILAEMDRKIDDGAPNTGGFQFSRYQGSNGLAAPTDGSTAAPACTSAATAAGVWNTINGSTNCGGASLL